MTIGCGGTLVDGLFHFAVRYTGGIRHPGGSFAMRGNDDLEDVLWSFDGQLPGGGARPVEPERDPGHGDDELPRAHRSSFRPCPEASVPIAREGRAGRVTEPLRVLFVCSRNRWRSPTAERIFARMPELAVRSAGTSSSARRTVSPQDLQWADVVLVMESKHRARLVERFGRDLPPIVVLEVPDDYRFMDPELVAFLEARVPDVLASFWVPK